MKKQPTQKPTRPRGRPKKPASRGKVAELRLRDLLKQIDDDSPPIDEAPLSLKIETLKGPQVLRMIATGQAVVIGRGFLRRLIAEMENQTRGAG